MSTSDPKPSATGEGAHITVWTYGNRPFVMGGDVVYILKTDMALVKRFTVRRFNLAVVRDASGNFRVASTDANGALISEAHATASLAEEAARNDMFGASTLAMGKQISAANADFLSRGHEFKEGAEFLARAKKGTP